MKKNTIVKTALATLLCTAFPLMADAHSMTVDDMTFLLRQVPPYSDVYAGPGSKLEKFTNVIGENRTVQDETLDFLRVVSYDYYGMKVGARTGKNDKRNADELGLTFYTITSQYHPLKCGIGVGSPLQDFVARFGKADVSRDKRTIDEPFDPNAKPILNTPYRAYYYQMGGYEFSIIVDNKQANKPIVQFGMTTEV